MKLDQRVPVEFHSRTERLGQTTGRPALTSTQRRRYDSIWHWYQRRGNVRRYNPSLKLAMDIAKVFGCTAEDLFEFAVDQTGY